MPIIKEVWTSPGCWATTSQCSSQTDRTSTCQQTPAAVRLSVGTPTLLSQALESCHHITKNAALFMEKIKKRSKTPRTSIQGKDSYYWH